MVGEVCEKQLREHNFANLTLNISNEDKQKLEDELKLEIAISLTLMVGMIQVYTVFYCRTFIIGNKLI